MTTEELAAKLREQGDQPAALFDVEPALFDVIRPAPAPELERLSPDRRRVQRQAQAIAGRTHPLALALRAHVPLHPDAALERDGEGLRCVDCRFRQTLAHHNRTYGKCTQDDGARITNGAGTDVRGWWPACRDFELGDPRLGPDAMRWRAEP